MGIIRLTPLAELDLRDIWNHGVDVWGHLQAERYLNAMHGTFELIADFPEIARLRTEFKPPVRLHPFQKHLIAYDDVTNGIDIIRILHTRSDILSLLDA